ncbi:MAG: ATP-binding cassette domain-containing protein [Saprospirales bacterium]|nr:ATP-binding cassette domain-containing protein [Saprospirales bacterium]MBK8489819.1 ATP-binding cassette domain-containing protein [Saprospirales bacterium]
MLSVEKLQHSYKSGASIGFPDFSCEKGAHWLLLGQSGKGKTTLLHLLGGLLTIQKGKVRVGDTCLNDLKRAEMDRFRGQHIGIIFQRSHFVRSLTVGENLALAQSLAGLPADWDRIQLLLDQLNVGHKARSKPDALSQGEQQRVAIARAIINRPTVILADEPTSALDDENTDEVIRLLEEEARSVGATLLIVTHDNRLKARFPKQIQL